MLTSRVCIYAFLLTLVAVADKIGQISLPAPESYIEYESFWWRVGQPLIFEIDFETNSPNGHFFALKAYNSTDDFVYQVAAYVKNRTTSVSQDFKNGVSSAGTTPKVVTDGAVHRLRVFYETDLEGTSVSDQLDGTKRDYLISSQKLDFLQQGDQIRVALSFGRLGEKHSIIGCVEPNVTLDGKPITLTKVTSEKVADTCPTPCKSGELKCANGGNCKDITFLQSVCDCYGTDFNGKTCDKESVNVVVDGRNVTDFYYLLAKAEDVQRIAFSFKPDHSQHFMAHSTNIFYTQIWKQVSETSATSIGMRVYYENRRITFSVDKVSKSFPQFQPDGSWHTFLLKIDYKNRVMNVKFDNELHEIPFEKKWRSQEMFVWAEKEDKGLNFGGRTSGLAGCLKDIFVDLL